MDRHDVSENVTAENVAQLHQKDLKIQHQFNCRGLTYWFDDKRKTAFCLIEAPNAKAIKKMHDRAHGQVPHSIIEVEASIVESFLGRIEDPEKAKNTGLNIINDPAFRAITVISLNRLAPPNNDSLRSKSSFRKFNSVVRKIVNAHGGKVVKQTNDQYLVSFTSVTKAVNAAFNIRLRSREFNRHKMKDKLIVKIGLSTGVPVTKKQLFFEDAIKLAERLCENVSGEIVLSAEVKDLYKSENANTSIRGEGIFAITQADEKFITVLMDYADKTWNDTSLKVDNFLRPLGCSKTQLYRRMILLTGKSLNTFIRDYRLKEALKVLAKNASNISETAFETGFSSPSYFTKCFKKKFGLLPASYLKSLQ